MTVNSITLNSNRVCCHTTAPSECYTLSLHDALPISSRDSRFACTPGLLRNRQRPPTVSFPTVRVSGHRRPVGDRKSTRLNSSHRTISYAVFCLKKKKTTGYRSYLSHTQIVFVR